MDEGSTNVFKWRVDSFATYACSCRICSLEIFIVFKPKKQRRLVEDEMSTGTHKHSRGSRLRESDRWQLETNVGVDQALFGHREFVAYLSPKCIG